MCKVSAKSENLFFEHHPPPSVTTSWRGRLVPRRLVYWGELSGRLIRKLYLINNSMRARQMSSDSRASHVLFLHKNFYSHESIVPDCPIHFPMRRWFLNFARFNIFWLSLPVHPPSIHPSFRQYKLALAWDPGGGLSGRLIEKLYLITVCELGRFHPTRASYVLFLHKVILTRCFYRTIFTHIIIS